jgi:hypothetical protein
MVAQSRAEPLYQTFCGQARDYCDQADSALAMLEGPPRHQQDLNKLWQEIEQVRKLVEAFVSVREGLTSGCGKLK